MGSEFRRRSMRAWLACAGGNPIVALAGKLAPLFGIFFVIGLSEVLILEGLLGIGFKGDVPMILAAGSLLIIGYLALGALMQLLVRDLATGLGLTGIIVSPAFGYAGVGFPAFGMNAFAQAWGAILPVRWYMAVLLGQAARGLPLSESARPFAALATLAVLYSLLAFLRLRAVARSVTPSPPAPAPMAAAAAPRDVGGAFVVEWQRVLALRGAFILLVVAPLVYGVFYATLERWTVVPLSTSRSVSGGMPTTVIPWPRSHRSVGRKPMGGGQGLARALGARGDLLRAHGDIRVSGEAEPDAWLVTPQCAFSRLASSSSRSAPAAIGYRAPRRRCRSSVWCVQPRSASRPRSTASSWRSRRGREIASGPATSWPSCQRSS
jgi:ABC-2 family transporter protein